MKVLTLTQPWATLVATGDKQIETRSWSTSYRGELAIHAAKGFPTWAKSLCYDACFKECLQFAGYKDAASLPTGVIIAVCQLVDVVRVTDEALIPKGKELVFGDYSLGRYMWKLANVKKLDRPITAKGSLGLWNFDMPTPEPEPAS